MAVSFHSRTELTTVTLLVLGSAAWSCRTRRLPSTVVLPKYWLLSFSVNERAPDLTKLMRLVLVPLISAAEAPAEGFRLKLPAGAPREWVDLFTGDVYHPAGGMLPWSGWDRFPVALLVGRLASLRRGFHPLRACKKRMDHRSKSKRWPRRPQR